MQVRNAGGTARTDIREIDVVLKPETDEPSSDPVTHLGQRLREHRLKSGVSLREVARQVGVSASFVSQFETGKSQPSVSTLYAFATVRHVH